MKGPPYLNPAELEFFAAQYDAAFNAATASGDGFAILDIITEHWRITATEKSWFSLMVDALTSPGSGHISYARRARECTQSFDADMGNAEDLGKYKFLFTLGTPEGRMDLAALDRRLQHRGEEAVNAEAGIFAAMNRMTIHELAPLLDTERKMRENSGAGAHSAKPPSARALHAAKVQAPDSGKPLKDACTVHPHGRHTNAQCYSQKDGPGGAGATVDRARGSTPICTLCNGPHKSPVCPQLAVAQLAATTAAKADRRAGHRGRGRGGQKGASANVVKKKLIPAARAVLDSASEGSDDTTATDDGTTLVGLDSMSDHHIINDRGYFIQKSIRCFPDPITVEGATGASIFSEYGSSYANDVLIEGAILCPTSPFTLLSVGRLFREHPEWSWKLSKASLGTLDLRALDDSGHAVIDAVTKGDLFLWKCRLGPAPRAAVQLSFGTGSHSRRAARAFPLIVPAAAPLVQGLAGPASVTTDPPNVPVLLPPESVYWEFAWWHRALGHPSLRVMRWYLKTFPHLDFGKIPPSLSCVACDEGKSHRMAMLPARAHTDPIIASQGDCFSVDIKTSTTPGYDNLKYTAVIVSHRTKYTWVLHAASKDAFTIKLQHWYKAYTVRHSATNGPLLMFRADNEAALFPADGEAFWASYGVVLSFAAPYTAWHNGTAESFIRTVFLCARTLLRDSEVENYFWPFAVTYAAFLLNRRPSRKAPSTTPYERLLRVAPPLPIVAWGCVGH